MPVSYLTDAERARLTSFPPEIVEQDLNTFFTLSPEDMEILPRTTSPANQLGFALQLCALRYLGFCPSVTGTPRPAVLWVAEQLGVSPDELSRYGRREQTRTDHFQQVQTYLGYRRPTEKDLAGVETWIAARAMEHERPTLLLQLACERFRSLKLVRIGATRLERLVAIARYHAREETYRLLSPLFSEETKGRLDSLLTEKERSGRTWLTWFRTAATSATANTILEALRKVLELREWGVETWDLRALNPNRRHLLAKLAKHRTAQNLQRLTPVRRYPILLSFLRQAVDDVADEAVKLFDKCCGEAYSDAAGELEDLRLAAAQRANEKVLLFQAVAGVILDGKVADQDVRTFVYKKVGRDVLEAALADCATIARPRNDNYFDLLATRYSHFRRFAPLFLETLDFQSNQEDDPLIAAINVLRKLNKTHVREVPTNAPTRFVPAKWKAYVFGRDGKINRRYYELCVLWELRAALRSGDIWLPNSRRYANLKTYLIPQESWPDWKPAVCDLLHAPINGAERIAERKAQLEELLKRVNDKLPSYGTVRMEGDDLVIEPIHAEEDPPSLKALDTDVEARSPLVDLSDLLLEVDSWTGFSKEFKHASTGEPPLRDVLLHCHASVIAEARDMGLVRMAQASDLSYKKLAWASTWYLGKETLRAANVRLVNYHHHLPLSRAWGSGTLSSSDGQRFAVPVKSTIAVQLPRYYAYGTGMEFYRWLSDQHSGYGIKPKSSAVRDATYVLDEIVDNETELPIEEHTTDTAGYTDLIFALFDLLGLRFSPRLRDIGSQRLFRIDLNARYPNLEALMAA
jgi:TnpA family transposase